MSNKNILKNATKYFVAIVSTIYFWQFAGRLGTAKNDIENMIGYFLFFAMAMIWFFIIKNDIKAVFNKKKE